MALMPAPPIPTMWMRWGVRRSSAGSGRSAGMRLDQLGHRGGGVGVPQASSRRAHGGEPVGIGEQAPSIRLSSRSAVHSASGTRMAAPAATRASALRV